MMSCVLPVGTILYRARKSDDPSFVFDANYCGDTGKVGLYFSDDTPICLGMALEYQYDIHLCSFVTTKPIVLFEGKYCFRSIHPERFMRDGVPYFDVEVLGDENICHYDRDAVPIYEGVNDADGESLGEIFIADNELDCLELVNVTELTLQECKERLGVQ